MHRAGEKCYQIILDIEERGVCNAPMLCQTLLSGKQVTIEEDPDRQYHLWSDLPFPSFHLS
jgi:hypothetical protein